MTYATTVLADSPLAYWKFDDSSGDFTDSSGNSRTLSASGSISYSQAGMGVGSEYAVKFNNTSARGKVASNSWHRITIPFTIEMWTKRAATAALVYLMGRRLSGSNLLTLGVDSSNKLFGYCYTDGSNYVDGGASGTFWDGNWKHLVVTIEASAMKFYVNASLTTTITSVGTVSSQASDAELVVCSASNGSGGYLSGPSCTADEFAIYNTLLSSTRITAHYDARDAVGTAYTAGVAGAATPAGTITKRTNKIV